MTDPDYNILVSYPSRWDYKGAFPKRNVDRFTISCPDCEVGRNSEVYGGNDRCFHCDTCGLIECVVTSPALQNDSINE